MLNTEKTPAADSPPFSPWRLCVAPMLDWTDKHCRHLHRLITRHARLYTEMVTCGALLHGSLRRHLRRDEMERPVALQLGGSDPAELAQCARLGQQWGYDEINLNCGCPSPRVQRGAFGACLMTQPRLVADCVKAMRDAVHIPVTVKHRIGIDREESHAFVRDFVGEVAQAGCGVFIVHARNAWLEGLSPKENREVPPLRHERVWQLKRDFPQLTICLNGGVSSNEQIAAHLAHVDGVMLGRAAYHHPWLMSEWDARFFGDAGRDTGRARPWSAPCSPTCRPRPRKTARPGTPLPATCWACATACAARAPGGRCGATTASSPCRPKQCGSARASTRSLTRQKARARPQTARAPCECPFAICPWRERREPGRSWVLQTLAGLQDSPAPCSPSRPDAEKALRKRSKSRWVKNGFRALSTRTSCYESRSEFPRFTQAIALCERLVRGALPQGG